MNIYPETLHKYILGGLQRSHDFPEESPVYDTRRSVNPQVKLDKYIHYIQHKYSSLTNFPKVPFSHLYLGSSFVKKDQSTNIVEFLYRIWTLVNSTITIPNIYSILYQMIKEDDSLKVKIKKLKFEDEYVIFFNHKIFNTNTLDVIDEFWYNEFIETITDKDYYDAIIYNISIFSTSSNSGHANVMIVTKDKNDKLKFTYYEPHGYEDRKISPLIFLMHLNDTLNTDLDSLEQYIEEKRMKSIGIQSIMHEYDIGYCVLFSLFWTYLSLRLLTLHKKFRISTIELFLSNFYNDKPELLMQTMLSFGTLFINYCIQHYSNQIDFVGMYSRVEQNKLSEPIEKIMSMYNKNKRKDGDVCDVNNDCNSGYCNNGKCVQSRRFTEHRPLNSECFMNEHCDSGYCDEGKCSKVPLYGKCEKDKYCLHGYCRNGICVPKKSGAKCSVKEDCESSLCTKGKCVDTKKRFGSKCKRGRDCLSGKCSNGKCS